MEPNMKRILGVLAFLFTLPAFAQNQGEPMGLGGGQSNFCRVGTPGSAVADAGDANYFSCKTDGGMYVDPVTQSITSSSALTVTAGAYVAGVNMGGKLTLASAGRAGANSLTVQSVTISDKAATAKNRTVIIFNANPTATTFTDNAALDIDDADLGKIACIIPLTVHQSFADNSVSTLNNVGCVVDLSSGTSMYAAVIAAENQTPGSTSDLTLGISFYQD